MVIIYSECVCMRERGRGRESSERGEKEMERDITYFVERRKTQHSRLLAELKLLISRSLSMLLVLPSSPVYRN